LYNFYINNQGWRIRIVMRTLTNENCFWTVTHDKCYAASGAWESLCGHWRTRIVSQTVTHEKCYADTDVRELFRRQWRMRNVMRRLTCENCFADSDAWEMLCGHWRTRIVSQTVTHEKCYAASSACIMRTLTHETFSGDAWELFFGKWRMSCLCWAVRWLAALHSWPAAAAGGPSHRPFLQPGIRIRNQLSKALAWFGNGAWWNGDKYTVWWRNCLIYNL
jgi:hypothetical protein